MLTLSWQLPISANISHSQTNICCIAQFNVYDYELPKFNVYDYELTKFNVYDYELPKFNVYNYELHKSRNCDSVTR